MRVRTVMTAVAMMVTALAAAVVTATPASATDKDGVLEPGEFGLYYLDNQSGWVFDIFVADTNFSNDVFPGTGISANNNTESYWNRDAFWWHVFTGANYTGSHGCLPSGHVGNASATFTNTISSAYYSSSSC